MTETLRIFDAMCCTRWPLLFGVAPRRCGLCGEVPVGIRGTSRTVTYEPTQHAPKLVATINRAEANR